MYKLISCWVFIIIVCLFFVGSLSFAQGLDSTPSGWEEAHKEAMAKVEEAEKEAKAKAEKEAMAKAAKKEAMAKEAKKEVTEKEEKEAVKEKRQKRFWEFWK